MKFDIGHPVETGKIFNLKHLLTTLVIVVLVVWVMQKIGKQTLVMYDAAGKETGRGLISYGLTIFKKK
jgi:hypothetical protein